MQRGVASTIAIACATVLLLIAAHPRAARPPQKPLSSSRSFEITDKSIVAPFTLDRVLAQLIERGGAAGLTPQQMMRQMFDTQNPKPGLADPAGPHCDDTLINGVPSFNGFPRRCPTPEATLAAVPYADGDYFTLGIANRFDLAPVDGSNCGQYRLIVAHREPTNLTFLHLIFEPVLPNPHPQLGLEGCRPVAQFWSDLSNVDSMDERRARLEQFFFNGLPGFAPLIDPPNFAAPGGIRTLQQSDDSATIRFYQFRLARQCAPDCTLRFTPDTLENFPFGRLFDASANMALGPAFRDEFVKQVETLAAHDMTSFHMTISKQYLMADGNPLDSELESNPGAFFDKAKSTPAGAAFNGAIQSELTRIGSTLTPDQIITRAVSESCFGCHGFAGLPLGEGVGFTRDGFAGFPMISDADNHLMDGEDGPRTRYGVDPVIETQFIPHRMQILADFLRYGKAPDHSK